MASILGKFEKQSGETLDYDVDFTDWFEGRSSTPVSADVIVPSGLTKVRHEIADKVVKVVLGGGTSGTKYQITVRLMTSDGLVKEADFFVSVKDI